MELTRTRQEASSGEGCALHDGFRSVRAATLSLVAGLGPEDLGAQSMADASPGKWHLAHTTWFLDAVVLGAAPGCRPIRPEWHVLFNSYYEALGPRHPRPQRGLLTRPTLEQVLAYRREVDDAVATALVADRLPPAALALLELGIEHEQQHQELLVTDLKHLFAQNPLRPALRPREPRANAATPACRWLEFPDEGAVEIGAPASGFAFDNERPRHRHWLRPFAIASRPVTNADFAEFVADGGYLDPRWWLSDGWATVQSERWEAPLYWQRDGDGWLAFTAQGLLPLAPAEPACHLSHYEADAYARWAGARLPTEFEWEHALGTKPWTGGFADAGLLHPGELAAESVGGDVWEWTSSAYLPYPGFVPLAGAAGEYNGKFMSGQLVLRGASCATPRRHARASYRNFFPPAARWQFSGLRLARDLEPR